MKMEEETKKVPFFPSVRFGMAVHWFMGSMVFYIIRFNFSVSIVCMTIDTPVNSTNGSAGIADDGSNQCDEALQEDMKDRGQFDWDRQMRGLLNSAFFMGYFLTHILGGVLQQKIGAKWVIFSGLCLMALATAMFEVSARRSPWALFAMRILLGMGGGVYVTNIRAIQLSWIPSLERSIVYTIQASGYSIGSVIAFSLSGAICDGIGWVWTFYIPVIFVLIWLLFWVIFGANSPDDYKYMSDQEKNYIIKHRTKQTDEKLPIPWRSIFTSMPCWCLFITDFCSAWGGYNTLTSGAQYMKDVLKFDIKRNGAYNALPHLCKFFMTIVAGIIVDVVRNRYKISTTTMRKVAQTVGFMGPALLTLGVAFLDCERRAGAVACLCLAEALSAWTRAGYGPSVMEVAPRYASIIGGICSTFGTVAGIVAPIAAGELTTNGLREEWQKVFFIGCGIYTFGWINFMIFAKAEPQPWSLAPGERTVVEVDVKNSEKQNSTINDEFHDPKTVVNYKKTTDLDSGHWNIGHTIGEQDEILSDKKKEYEQISTRF